MVKTMRAEVWQLTFGESAAGVKHHRIIVGRPMRRHGPSGRAALRYRVPQVAVLRDLCILDGRKAQVCEYADLWHPN
jgi:hypothetical protein